MKSKEQHMELHVVYTHYLSPPELRAWGPREERLRLRRSLHGGDAMKSDRKKRMRWLGGYCIINRWVFPYVIHGFVVEKKGPESEAFFQKPALQRVTPFACSRSLGHNTWRLGARFSASFSDDWASHDLYASRENLDKGVKNALNLFVYG